MRIPVAVGLLILGVCISTGLSHDTKASTPEQVEKNLPKDVVTVTCRVEDVGVLLGGISAGDPPLMMVASAKLKDKRSQFYVVLVGKALTHINRLAFDPAKHFHGKTIEISGKVEYITLPQIPKKDGSVEVPADRYTNYQMVIDDLDNFRVVR